ncbi:MAG: hypothetical protein ABIJ46_02935 [bacterium]
MIQVSGPEQHGSSRNWRTNRLIAFAFVAVAAGIAAFSFFMVFSRATVVVLSDQMDVGSGLIVDVAAAPSGDEVPGLIYELARTSSETVPIDHAVPVETRAEGRVRITSELSRSQTLVASTRLLTPDGVLFRLQETVVVPAFGSVEGLVAADEPGGSVGETTFTIPGLNEDTRRRFTVETVGTLVGGHQEMKVLTEEELARAQDRLADRLRSELRDELRRRASDDGSGFDGELLTFETVDQSADREVGDEADSFEVTATIRGRAVFFGRAAFDSAVRRMLASRLSFGREISSVSADTDGMEIEKIDLIGRRANVRVAARGTSVLSADAAGLDPEKLVGITADAAVQYLESLDGVSSASVKLSPFWVSRLPNVAEHIRIEVR